MKGLRKVDDNQAIYWSLEVGGKEMVEGRAQQLLDIVTE